MPKKMSAEEIERQAEAELASQRLYAKASVAKQKEARRSGRKGHLTKAGKQTMTRIAEGGTSKRSAPKAAPVKQGRLEALGELIGAATKFGSLPAEGMENLREIEQKSRGD